MEAFSVGVERVAQTGLNDIPGLAENSIALGSITSPIYFTRRQGWIIGPNQKKYLCAVGAWQG